MAHARGLHRTLVLALMSLVLIACSSPPFTNPPGRTTKPRVIVGSTNFTEQVLLAELYAQALEAQGYIVERRLNLGSREGVEPALEAATIDLYPEYLASMLTFLTKDATRASSDPAVTHARLREVLRGKDLAVLDYAPAANTNGFAVTRATAAKYQLEKLSDLPPVAPQLVLGGPPECPVRAFCLAGLRERYGIRVKDLRILDTGGPLTVAALEDGRVDIGLLFTTDPVIKAKQFVLLADDKHLQQAENVAPVVRAALLSRAPADFPAILNGVSAKLTTEELTSLNGQVTLFSTSPAEAASAWLRGNRLIDQASAPAGRGR